MGFMTAEVMYFCYEYEGLFYARDHILSERIDMYHAKKRYDVQIAVGAGELISTSVQLISFWTKRFSHAVSSFVH